MNNKKGMTMVEVMVAFVILLIGLASLYKATVFAGEQVKKSQIVKEQVDNLMEGYYTENRVLAKIDEEKVLIVKFALEEKKADIAKGTEAVKTHWIDYVSEKGYHLQSLEKE